VKKKSGEPEIVRSARELQNALDHMERLTGEIAKAKLTSRGKVSQAAEMLDKAAGAHRQFLAGVAALTQAVAEMRDRQNQSAATLSELRKRSTSVANSARPSSSGSRAWARRPRKSRRR
jgi:ABC-type transporter Mla subunit MlaD